MIKKIKNKLSVKVFLLTAILITACCTITYLCISHFAPYIYSYGLPEVEDLGNALAEELSHIPKEEAPYVLQGFQDMLVTEYKDEFAFHLFQDSGEELDYSWPELDTFTGRHLDDYPDTDRTKKYKVSFLGKKETYFLLLAQNTNKESQIVLALQKTLPLLSVVIFLVSIIAAFFYTWYLTRPIKRISRLSRQMADMDFSGLCPVNRTDEIGVLSDSLNDLSKKLAAALSELQETNQKLQADIDRERQLERQRTEFFSAASHELKTPITIIKGQLQGMLYQVGRYKDRETYLAKSLEVTDTLENMVQELLTISRLDTPGYVCKKHSLDMSKLLNDRLLAYEDLFLQRDLTVEKSIPLKLSLSGDIRLLQKALDNLLGNAAAYSEAGNRIIVRLWIEDGRKNLTIENTGAHIPEEDIPRLFEAFYRVDQSRNRQTGGTGLGLYIVKTILNLHGAKVQIANTAQGVIISIQFQE